VHSGGAAPVIAGSRALMRQPRRLNLEGGVVGMRVQTESAPAREAAAALLTTPLLMVHSDGCAFPDAVRRHFAVVATPDRQLVWDEHTRHLQYYGEPELVDRTVWQAVGWFSRHLGSGQQ
jgi:hypothetical protein